MFIKHKDTEVIPTIKATNKHLVTAVLTDFLFSKKNLENNSFEWYDNLSKSIKKLLSGVYIEDMDFIAVQKFVNQLHYKKNGELYSEVTIKGTFKVFKMVYQFAYDSNYQLKRVNFRKIKLPHCIKNDPHDKNLTDEQLSLIFGAVKDSFKYNTFVRILSGTGVRIGELLALKWDDIDFEAKTLRVDESVKMEKETDDEGRNINISIIGNTKTVCSVRTVNITDGVLALFNAWKEYVQGNNKLMERIKAKGNSNMVFTDQNGNIQKYNTLQNHFRNYLKRHGIEDKVTFHMFRHVCATRLKEDDAEDSYIQSHLGHKSVSTTIDIYVSMTEKARKKGFENHHKEIDNVLAL